MNEKNRDVRKGYHRGQFFFFLGRNVIGIPFKLLYRFKGEAYRIKETPFLLFANHTDNMDPAYELASINKYIRFVVSDHLTRKASLRILLKVLASPIIYHREKGSGELYDEIVRNISAGINVGMFIEGQKSNNGETGFISIRNAELVKECGCSLITYKNKGGYLKHPRWALNKRKGPSFGEIVNIYSKTDIEKMSVDEVYKHICEDLYFNAYEEQRINPHKYIAEAPAESAEIILYACPGCRKIGTLSTQGDKIFCDCGFSARIDDLGFWHGDNMEFDDIVRWDKFQRSVLKELCEEKRGTSDFVFEDKNQIVYILDSAGNRVLQDENGVLTLYGDRIELRYSEKTVSVPLEDIKNLRIAAKMNILLILDDCYYELHSNIPRSAIKYVVAQRYLQGKDYF